MNEKSLYRVSKAHIVQIIPVPFGYRLAGEHDDETVLALALCEFECFMESGEKWTGREILPVRSDLRVYTSHLPDEFGWDAGELLNAFGDSRGYLDVIHKDETPVTA